MRNSHLEERESDWTREIYHVCMKEILVGLVEINSHEFEVKPVSVLCSSPATFCGKGANPGR